MAINNGDILTYILTNRLHYEDGEYLLQEKVETMGEDAVGSARAWLYGRFLQAGETDTFDAFMTATYDDLVVGNLTKLEDIRAAYLVITADATSTSIYTMLFDAFIRLSVAYIWKASGMEGEAEPEEKMAQELIVAIVGAVANPENILGDSEGADAGEAALGSVVTVYPLTADEIKVYTEGYE
jgi:hypothetical protein